MKKWLALLAAVTLLCLAMGASAETVDLESLILEIEEQALLEEFKEDDATDAIHVNMDIRLGQQFYTGQSVDTPASVRIENYDALKEALGGEPVYHEPEDQGRLGLSFAPSGDGSMAWILLTVDGSDEYESLPTDTAGAYSLAGSVTWGDLEAEIAFPFTVTKVDPPLEGMAGIADLYTAEVNEPVVIRAETDPAGWSFEGLTPQLSLTLKDQNGSGTLTLTRDSAMQVSCSADQTGVYALEAEVSVRDGNGRLVYSFSRPTRVIVGDYEAPTEVDITWNPQYTDWYVGQMASSMVGALRIDNYSELRAAYGEDFWFDTPRVNGLSLRFEYDYDDPAGGLYVVSLSGENGEWETVPESALGENVLKTTITCGDAAGEMTTRVNVTRWTGPVLEGIEVEPYFKAQVNERHQVIAKPIPADWACEGYDLRYFIAADGEEFFDAVDILSESGALPELAFKQEGVYPFDVCIYVREKTTGRMLFVKSGRTGAYIGDVETPDNVTAICLDKESLDVELYPGMSDYLGEVQIINYETLVSAFGGAPTITSSVSGRLSMRAYLWGSSPSIYLLVDGARGGKVPEDVIGEYQLTLTFTWGDLTAELPVRLKIKPFEGPALVGISGLPDYFAAEVGARPYRLTIRPDPEDWAWEGLTLTSDLFLYDEAWQYAETYRYDDSLDIGIHFSKEGLFQFDVVLSAVDDTGKTVFQVSKEVLACIGDTGTPESTDRLLLTGNGALTARSYAGCPSVYIGSTRILNYDALANALGGKPTVTSTPDEAGCPLTISGELWGDTLRFRLTVNGDPDQLIPESCAGTHRFTAAVKWGSLSTDLTATVSILSYDGPELTGVTGAPETYTAGVDEWEAFTLKPVPEDWSCQGYRLLVEFNADQETWEVMRINSSELSVNIAFSRAGVYTFDLGLCVVDSDYYEVRRVTQKVTARIGAEGDALAITETNAVSRVSEDARTIYIAKPTITGGTAPYQIAYNCYDDQGNAVNYYYSDAAETAMTPGADGRYNVYVVVTDAAGAAAQVDTGWVTLDGYADDTGELRIEEEAAPYTLSEDGKTIFLSRPTIRGGTKPYQVAYNCYSHLGEAVNYYYSDDAATAMTPGHNGRYNVYVVVTDAAGASAQVDTGWLDLQGYADGPLAVAEEIPVFELSADGKSIYINRPTASGGTGIYTFAYNCYDEDSNPVNYYYSGDWRTAMTPGYAGRFCVFVVISDGNESVTINTGWVDLE